MQRAHSFGIKPFANLHRYGRWWRRAIYGRETRRVYICIRIDDDRRAMKEAAPRHGAYHLCGLCLTFAANFTHCARVSCKRATTFREVLYMYNIPYSYMNIRLCRDNNRSKRARVPASDASVKDKRERPPISLDINLFSLARWMCLSCFCLCLEESCRRIYTKRV